MILDKSWMILTTILIVWTKVILCFCQLVFNHKRDQVNWLKNQGEIEAGLAQNKDMLPVHNVDGEKMRICHYLVFFFWSTAIIKLEWEVSRLYAETRPT